MQQLESNRVEGRAHGGHNWWGDALALGDNDGAEV